MSSTISVIIVSWNARGFLRDCLESIRRNSFSGLREVIVVDNASTDGSSAMVAEEFPEVKLIRCAGNLGFARANNIGIQHATGEYVALVNSDVVLHPGCWEKLAAFLDEHPKVGLVGPRILGSDNRLQRSCRQLPTVWNTLCRILALDAAFPRSPFFSGKEMLHWDHDVRAEVEVLSGCFWLTRLKVINQIGGLDERFFFYAEDVDWCKRLKEDGWKIVFLPEAVATHFGGGSSSNAPLRYSIAILKANLAYWKKHHGVLGWSAYYFLSVMHHGLRFLARLVCKITRPACFRQIKEKFQEDVVCLRWLLVGKGV